MSSNEGEVRVARWYFGGLAGAGAACCTHPLDLLKVHLQTGGHVKQMNIVNMTIHIVKNDGVLALYSGLTGSILRQMTYTLTRFAVYGYMKDTMTKPGEVLPFHMKVLLAGVSGAAGGFVGTPGDMINVRMQNDVKLPKAQRRNYAHALDGLWKVYKHEGLNSCFNGASAATGRAVLMNIGQLSFYDQAKQVLLESGMFVDNFLTHFLASFIAGGAATILTQPVDVVKTRMMNAKPGEYTGMMHCITDLAKTGPMAFYKGLVPAFIRLAPHTILLFVFFEQLRMKFGTVEKK